MEKNSIVIEIEDLELISAVILDEYHRQVADKTNLLTDRHHIKIDDLEVRIKVNADKDDGQITIKYVSPCRGRNKPMTRNLKLRDGSITIGQRNASCKPRVTFVPRSIERVLEQRFGITEIHRKDPNNTFAGFFELADDWSRASFMVVSDGETSYYTNDSRIDLSISELLDFNYRGKLKAKVENATWAVICEMPCTDEPSEKCGFKLYSSCNNLWFLIPKLEECLRVCGLGRFEDALEDIEVQPEMMELFG